MSQVFFFGRFAVIFRAWYTGDIKMYFNQKNLTGKSKIRWKGENTKSYLLLIVSVPKVGN